MIEIFKQEAAPQAVELFLNLFTKAAPYNLRSTFSIMQANLLKPNFIFRFIVEVFHFHCIDPIIFLFQFLSDAHLMCGRALWRY